MFTIIDINIIVNMDMRYKLITIFDDCIGSPLKISLTENDKIFRLFRY